ncbi:hypothetical protein E0Z10_g6658 [Xylaria hypoxylon]|uniref:F-box domain-containing protein n=1 Tax=Xylaria hypoxylon TaxID=37992 RepID=A0A4Z0YCY6_9PEZI|nr:hypothetical protein E0Z10_g6658 [Xylaria hypoxylon]
MTIPGLQRLPYELVAYIVEGLDIEDVFHWSLCSKHFQYIIREDLFCKPVVLTKVPGTLEARDALKTGRFSRALRRLAKRRNALSQASPYVVGIVACADSYGFFGGKLCYIIEARPQRWLRILDIHHSTDQELVVNIPMLIREAVPRAAKCRKYKFRVLYQAAGIVSCLFSFAMPVTENWLLVLNPQTSQILQTSRLDSIARIFVRNNDKFLYLGTHSEEGADGFRKWVIKGFDLNKLSWFPQPRMYMANLAGCDMGLTVCFEIFGDYFYGLSNQNLFETDDPEWTSHYYCFRFPLHEPSPEKMQVMKKEDSWRRKHAEGPIDDRWGFLSLEIDETSGGIVILECRKEWLKDQSGSQRTYYTTEVVFYQQTIQEDHPRVRADTTWRGIGDHPQCEDPIPFRRPEYVHTGDDSSIASLLVRSKTHFCAYIRCCHTFVDLIDDTYMDTSSVQRLRLRTGYRKLKPSAHLLSKNSAPETLWAPSESSKQPAMQPYQANTIYIWPPEQNSPEPDPSLSRIQQLLDVEDHQGCVTATGDERSVIYATGDGSKGGVKALVFISFDPAARFEGMEYGGDIPGQRISHDPQERSDPSTNEHANPSGMSQYSPNVPLGAGAVSCSEADSSVSRSLLDTGLASPADQTLPLSVHNLGDVDSWACYEKAMHFEIQRKLYFGRQTREA